MNKQLHDAKTAAVLGSLQDDAPAEPSAMYGPTGAGMLAAMGRLGKHVYGATVPPRTVQRRRQRNRMAGASRRANRR